MEEENKYRELAGNDVCKEAASEQADVGCKCHGGHLKPHKRHAYCLLIACFMLLLQIITLGLLLDMRCHMKHRMHRHGDFRPPIHRFEEDCRREQRGGFKSGMSEEPVREQRPEMEHEGASDMHEEQVDPDTQAM